MSIQPSPSRPLHRFLRTVLALVNSDLLNTLSGFWSVGKRLVSRKPPSGMYEVLEHETRLELKDDQGKKAVLYKRQRVRFCQDNIITYQDKAWGDGDIFADYQCSPGVPVDRYREGHRYRVLISLRETKHKGDIEEFRIERTIRNGFTKKVEDFQTEIDHVTGNLSVSVVFPRQRRPRQVTLIEQNADRARPLSPQQIRLLPDGRSQATWRTKNPKLYEGYILRWTW